MKLQKRNYSAGVKYFFYLKMFRKPIENKHSQHNYSIHQLAKNSALVGTLYTDQKLNANLRALITREQFSDSLRTVKIDKRIIDTCSQKLSTLGEKMIKNTNNYQMFFNENKVGFDLNIDNSKITEMYLFKTNYFNTELTNRLMKNNITEDIRFSNQIGIHMLCITSDSKLLVPRQGSNNNVSKGLLIPTASGSLDWNDYQEGDLIKAIERGMVRECLEENQLDDQEDLKFGIKIIGLTFDQKASYKADFMAIAFVNKKAYNFKCSKEETFDREEYRVANSCVFDDKFSFKDIDVEMLEKLNSEFKDDSEYSDFLKVQLSTLIVWLKSEEDKSIEMKSVTNWL